MEKNSKAVVALRTSVDVNRDQRGFTITEIIITLAITLMLAAAVGAVLVQTKKNQNRISADSTRAVVSNNIQFSASNAMALKASAERSGQPSLLQNCFCGRASCTANTPVEFTLTDISGKVLAGTTAQPQRYDISGNLCPITAANCIYEAVVRFECKGTLCGTGTFLDGDPVTRVTYELKLTASAKANKKEFSYLKDIQSLPIDSSMKSLRRYAATLCP